MIMSYGPDLTERSQVTVRLFFLLVYILFVKLPFSQGRKATRTKSDHGCHCTATLVKCLVMRKTTSLSKTHRRGWRLLQVSEHSNLGNLALNLRSNCVQTGPCQLPYLHQFEVGMAQLNAMRAWIWARFLESLALYEPLIWVSEEASVKNFSLDEYHWD